jgi:class 3 adenylate cyclase
MFKNNLFKTAGLHMMMIVAKFKYLLSLMGAAVHQNALSQQFFSSIDTQTEVLLNSGEDADSALSDYRRALNALMLSGVTIPEDFKAEMELKFLHLVAKGRIEEAKELCEIGISVHTIDYHGRSALHIASENGHEGLVAFLIDKSLEINHRDNFGMTPMMLAASKNHMRVVRQLRNAGAEGLPLNSRTQRSMHASFAVMEAFPHSVAVAMLQGKNVQPISKNPVSLFFSEIVGFPHLISEMDASRLSNMLSRLFKKLDMLAYLHGVQRVDIIGDAYIAAANLSDDQPDDHAARLARFAIAAVRAARETPIDPAGPLLAGHVQLRAGLHCGAVSGFLVGSHGLKYTLAGDAVNVAARMQSTCAAGRIQCSEDFARAAGDQAHDIILACR